MRKNSFGQGLAIFLVIIGVLFVIGSIGEASEPKCIKAGCDNKQASGSSYCYLHKPYTGSSTSHSSLQTSHHIAVVQRKVQRQRRVHMTLMMMAMMISIWMTIMTMTDMTETAIMQMV